MDWLLQRLVIFLKKNQDSGGETEKKDKGGQN